MFFSPSHSPATCATRSTHPSCVRAVTFRPSQLPASAGPDFGDFRPPVPYSPEFPGVERTSLPVGHPEGSVGRHVPRQGPAQTAMLQGVLRSTCSRVSRWWVGRTKVAKEVCGFEFKWSDAPMRAFSHKSSELNKTAKTKTSFG